MLALPSPSSVSRRHVMGKSSLEKGSYQMTEKKAHGINDEKNKVLSILY